MANNIVRVGNVEIMSLSDGMLEFDLCNFFPTIPADDWHQYESHLTDEHKVRFNLGSFLVRGGGRTILVDTGLGPKPENAPDAPWGQLMHDFARNGVRPDEVDMVVLTHLHRDHVGWNLMAQGPRYTPTFPKARYWMSLADLGLIEFMEGEHSITPELSAVPTPGHTPGHMSILITSQGARALVLGDAAHNPAQVLEPDWVSRADMDPDLTRQTRRALMERLEREAILVAAGHFPAPGFGRIVRLQGRRYWQGL
jgi:glyoxylase-like metal-dependent hydrolase (beta-lactamase superfamily II)